MTVPRSTYRLQLHPGFTFADALAVVGYLADLGVDAVYVSPVLDATPGSTHGYDVTDATLARPALGGDAGFKTLTDAIKTAGLGMVVDIVPNHMSVEVPAANAWWWDVLRNGRNSPYADYFDIDWSRGRILVPVLGSDDDIAALTIEGNELVYYDHRFPINGTSAGQSPQDVHDRQHYELVGWRRGNAELNYRRFFDITTLAAVCVERPEVFADTHRAILRWVASGDVTGLRVDHPDGLADPGRYMQHLRAAAPEAWLVVEKILAPGEALPASWPVDGTTGYDVLGEIAGLFIDPAGEQVFAALANDLGLRTDFHAVEEEARRLVTDRLLVAEVHRIAALLDGVPVDLARAAVAETMIAFPVYRSYLPEGADAWGAAITLAGSRQPDLGEALIALDHQVQSDPAGELATRIQQTSGMVVAKGTEDTTFYRYTRFAALNEVGGSPDRFGVAPAAFHLAAEARESDQPRTMTTLTTHDTKRSEDTRARMAVLSEVGPDFADAVKRWTSRQGIDEPSLNLLAWQTLVGAWPISNERLRAYLDKAAKESKLRTTWTDHDEAFEEEVAAWPAKIHDDADLAAEVAAFVKRIEAPGWSNSLGQKLVQLTSPGVPDLYQGTELWDFSLVDPDNRRPVDYETRRALLARIEAGELPAIDESGAAKMLVVHHALKLRRDRPEIFRGYRPVPASGAAADHVVAFARSDELVAVATRLPVGLAAAGGWRDTVLPLAESSWTNVLTGERLDARPRLDQLLSRYPVALLVRDDR